MPILMQMVYPQKRLPENLSDGLNTVALGRYRLPLRLAKPISTASTTLGASHRKHKPKTAPAQACACNLIIRHTAAKSTRWKPIAAKAGSFAAKLISISALSDTERHLLIAAVTDSTAKPLPADDPEKLLKLPARVLDTSAQTNIQTALAADIDRRRQQLQHDARC